MRINACTYEDLSCKDTSRNVVSGFNKVYLAQAEIDYERTKSMYLLTDREGWTGKYLARGWGLWAMTKGQN